MPNDNVKSEAELAAIRRAASIIDDVYERLLKYVCEGMTEKEISDWIRSQVIGLGGSGTSFDTIVAIGANGAEPHHVPNETALYKGALVTVDMGTVYEGMCSDFTRTFAFGAPSEKQKEIYEIVYRAQKLALTQVKAGAECKFIDSVAREYIEERGYGQFYIHGTGHGVGELIHEAPTLNSKSEEILKPNTVVTVEPGIYLPDEMGIRIEDMIIVGESAPLSRHHTELLIING